MLARYLLYYWVWRVKMYLRLTIVLAVLLGALVVSLTQGTVDLGAAHEVAEASDSDSSSDGEGETEYC
jgi:hypothetical protein